MPLIYRTMTREGDKPKVGPSARTLGVRPGVDIVPDEGDMVLPQTGGMSVAPSWRKLPPHRIPLRLQPLVRDACGKDEDACWRMGSGEFIDSKLTESLSLRRDKTFHGLVEPSRRIGLNEFQTALAASRDLWEIDEA